MGMMTMNRPEKGRGERDSKRKQTRCKLIISKERGVKLINCHKDRSTEIVVGLKKAGFDFLFYMRKA